MKGTRLMIITILISLALLLVSSLAWAGESPIPAIPDLIPLAGGLLLLSSIVVGCVAGIKKIVTLDGWKTIAVNVVVSMSLCVSLIAWTTPTKWWQGIILGALVAIFALCGDVYLVRLFGKACKQTSVNWNVSNNDPKILGTNGLPYVPDDKEETPAAKEGKVT